MSKLVINSKNINNDVIPSITETITHLNNALNYINLVSIPNECDISMTQSKNDIESIKNNLNSLKEWCDTSVLLLSKIEEKYVGEASSLPNNIIELRQNKIKE